MSAVVSSYGVYAVYDRVQGCYGAPRVDVDDACAIRYFKFMNFGNLPSSDFDLYKLGLYDPNLGRLIPVEAQPELLFRGGSIE